MNAQTISVMWSPVHDTIDLPLYAIIIGSLLLGFITGCIALWFNTGHLRKTKRQQKKQIKTLEKELATSQEKETTQKPPSDFFPAITDAKSRKSA